MSEDFVFKFLKLTPTNSADISGYEEALDYVFDDASNTDIHNVAISGIYGSGKSSIINTYANQKNKNFIHIYLAHFNGEKNEEDESEIEKKIINSIIQQIPHSKVPDSKFQVKADISGFSKIITSRILAVMLFLFYLANAGRVNSFFEKSLDEKLRFYILLGIGVLLGAWALYSLVRLIYTGVSWQNRSRLLSKISFKWGEINVKDEEKSYFDKHLDEILYLIVNSGCDGFVFEDMDRFVDSRVKLFEHLRELCNLANERINLNTERKTGKHKNEKKAIRFFYLISDATFTTEDRTKFFDYVISVIPVIDSSNSYSELKNYLESANLYKEIKDRFLRGLSLFINDMRLARSIVNDYQLYYKKLGKVQVDATKLLAMMAYKNTFPDDFVKLQDDRGFLYEIFSKKQKIQEEECKKLNAEIKELMDSKLEALEEQRELEVIRNDRRSNSHNPQYSMDFRTWEQDIYPKRKKAIDDKLTKEKDYHDKQIREKKKQLLHLRNKKLFELLEEGYKEEVFDVTIDGKKLSDCQYYQLLVFLIQNSYIDEDTYRDCISYYYDGGMTINDKNYLIAVNSRKEVGFEDKIDNIELVFESLDDKDFLTVSTRNRLLIDYIINNNRKQCIDLFFTQLEERMDYDFVAEYYSSSECSMRFIKLLVEHWGDSLEQFIHSTYSDEEDAMDKYVVQRIVLDALVCSSEEVIKSQNDEDTLSEYLSSELDAVECNNENVEKLTSSFKLLNVKLEDIHKQIHNRELFDALYAEELYILNTQNITTILKQKYGIADEEFGTATLTHIFADENQPLYTYVRNNLNEVVLLCLDESDEIADDESAVALILNSDIAKNIKVRYINALNYKVQNITDYNEDTWDELLSKRKIIGSTQNVLALYKKNRLSVELIKLINECGNNIAFESLAAEDNVRKTFWIDAYDKNDIKDEIYDLICECLGTVMDSFNTSGINEEKISILLKYGLLPVTANNLNVFRTNYKGKLLDFICKDIDNYLLLIPQNAGVVEETLGVLDRNNVANDKKIQLLKKSPQLKVSLNDKTYDDELTLYILNNHYTPEDLEYLIKKYNDYTGAIQDEIYSKSKASLGILAACEYIPLRLLERVFGDKAVPLANKARILDAILDKEDNNTIAKLLVLADQDNIAKLFKEGNFKLRVEPNDTGHIAILDVLKSHNNIEDYDKRDDGLKIQRKRN